MKSTDSSNILFWPKVISAEIASFGRITERGESRKAETETCFGRNFWPKPNRNSIRLTTNFKPLAQVRPLVIKY